MTPTENSKPQTGNPAPAIPGAWYDLACRVGAAKAVAACAQDTMTTDTGAGLLAALQDLLMLMAQDVDLIETQLKL